MLSGRNMTVGECSAQHLKTWGIRVIKGGPKSGPNWPKTKIWIKKWKKLSKTFQQWTKIIDWDLTNRLVSELTNNRTLGAVQGSKMAKNSEKWPKYRKIEKSKNEMNKIFINWPELFILFLPVSMFHIWVKTGLLRAVKGPKMAKNGQKWPKIAKLTKKVILNKRMDIFISVTNLNHKFESQHKACTKNEPKRTSSGL